MEMLLDIDSIFSNGQNPKQVQRINTDLSSSKTRHDGLMKLNKLLNVYDNTIIAENAVAWIKTLSQIISQVHDLFITRQLAAENFALLLSQCCQIPSVSREISSSLIPTTLSSFLQRDSKDSLVLSAIYAIVLNYPTSCGDSRSRIVKFMMPMMLSTNKEKKVTAIKCWSKVPFLGGGGTQRSTHSQQWKTQFDQTIQLLKLTFCLYTGEEGEEASDPSIGSLSFPLPQLPATEPQLSDTLIQRMCMLSESLQSLLNIDFQVAVPIEIGSIMTILFDILDLTPAQLGNTSEMLHRASFLSVIHVNILQLSGKLSQICRRNLCRYSSKINKMFSSLLDLWNDKSPVHGKNNKYSVIRTQIYNSILDWIKNCGATCRFLCGPYHLNQITLKHIIDDFVPVSNSLTVSNATIQINTSKKAKKRRLNDASQQLLNNATCNNIRNPKVNLQLCTTTLKVVLQSIYTLGHRLSGDIHKILQENIILILLRLQQGEIMDPYSSCPAPRLLLYKVFIALVLSPSSNVAPPTALATNIFSCALSNEKNSEIRSFCTEAISSLNVIIHPWRNSWNVYSVANAAPDGKQDFLKIIPVIRPMNIEMNGDGDHRINEGAHNRSEETIDSSIVGDDNIETQEHSLRNGSEIEDEIPVVEDSMSPEKSFSTSDTLDGTSEEEESTNNIEAMNCDIVVENSDCNIINKDEASPTRQYENNDETTDVQSNAKTIFHLPNLKSSVNDRIDASVDVADVEEDVAENMEEVNKMLLDFVDDSPDEDE